MVFIQDSGLHPSWAAKKLQKQNLGGISNAINVAAVTGKKIIFDDS